VPFTRQTFQRVRSAINQPDRRARQRGAHGVGDQDLVGLRDAHHAGGSMHVQSADFLAAGLTRPGVHAGSDAQTQWSHRLHDGGRAAYRGTDRVEHREESVTRRVDFVSAELPQRTPHGGPIVAEQCIPALVAQAHQELCGTDDVGEQEAERGGRHGARVEARTAHSA
jgi:hypothetical protein